MPLATAIREMLARISQRNAARRRLAQFTCADCARWQQCDLPPNTNCLARQVQIARGDWDDRRRAKALPLRVDLDLAKRRSDFHPGHFAPVLTQSFARCTKSS